MLELKNVTRIYRTKAGETRALDNVSIVLPEKGMVFVLGKSGCGKSTLLNVCGGLDVPDEGEIFVKGRSTKEFTQTDLDSYRNTCVGFVFQEYNILSEFSVEDNIAIALELQGKQKDSTAIADILRQVELEDVAKRKPDTLSGGQKQRVAIARALVKNPEIIMADKKREIGILRAVGAKSSDVFKIFLSESMLIVAVCSLASIIITAVISAVVNAKISAALGLTFSPFAFGILSVLMIIGISVITALISTILPAWFFSKKKPVDTIRNL